MNTNRLFSEYEQEYKNFFNKYDIVISSPLVVSISGDISNFNDKNCALLTQKIALRNYIGYNFKKVKNREIEYIVRDNGFGFVRDNIETKYALNRNILDSIGLTGEVGFLSEYNWLDPPSFLSNILSLKLLIDKEIKVEDFEKLDLDKDDYREVLDKVLYLDEKLLTKHNLFGSVRNNGLFIGTSLLRSNSHILGIKKDGKFYYQNAGKNHDFNQLDLSFSLINPNIAHKNSYNSNVLDYKNDKLSLFLEEEDINLLDKDNLSLNSGLVKISNFYSFRLFKDLLGLYENNYSFSDLYRHFDVYRNTIRSLFNNKIDNDYLKKIMLNNIHEKDFKLALDNIGVFGFIRMFCFNTRVGYVDEVFIDNINSKNSLKLDLDYSSFYDGYERAGVKIEQYRSELKLSQFSSNYVLEKYKNGRIEKIYGEYSDFIEEENNGLVLDLIENKIYFNGKKLTSKDIHSQSTTIEILEKLLKNYGKNVSNKDLSKSSYTSNKNDMLGKIVIPLNKLIEEKTSKKLGLTCIGKILEFNLKIKNKDIEICFIKRLV